VVAADGRRYYWPMNRGRPGRWSIMLLAALAVRSAGAQTDEIQVYTGELAAPGQASLTVHANYTPRGKTVPEFPGGVVPDGSVNGAFEWAYGVAPWFEAGTYVPVYSITRDGHVLLEGAKLRALFAVPHAESRRFFYGVNFELSFNSKAWDENRHSGEIRPIIGARAAHWDFIVNPILDTEFDGVGRLDFAPSARIAYNASPVLAVAVEHYADFGELRHIDAGEQREQNLFGVVDIAGKELDFEAGVGFGLTRTSDKLVLKTILAHTF
jgi:hypothetical protein